MKAVSLPEPGRLEIVDIPEPEVGPEDVLLEVHYVGLCGSDLNAYRGNMPLVTFPRIPGHEVSGRIIAKGTAVPEAVREGTRVTLSPYSNCGLCPACRTGRPNCCEYNQTLGVQRDGALMSRFAIPYREIFPGETLSYEELVLVEPLSVGYHGANRGRVSEVDTVLVIGCGTVGFGAIAGAVRKGATVVALDIDDTKLEHARKFGATHTINSMREDPLDRIHALTQDEGVSVAIEAVGLPQTFRLAVEAVAFAGRVVYIGYAKKEVTYDTTAFVRKELDIMGARNALRVFRAVIQMMERREQPFTDLITRVYPLEETEQALRDWDADPGAFTKILIDVHGSGISKSLWR